MVSVSEAVPVRDGCPSAVHPSCTIAPLGTSAVLEQAVRLPLVNSLPGWRCAGSGCTLDVWSPPGGGFAALALEGRVVRVSESTPRRLFARKRRENATEGAREKYYRVYVTAEEDAALQARAVVAGDITVPRLLFESAMNAQVRTDAEWKSAVAELMQVRADLGGMARNLNQLARFANTEGQFPAQVEEFRAQFAALVPQISAACRSVAGK